MSQRRKTKILSVCITAVLLVAGTSPGVAKTYLAYGGGPVGGTFNYFANAMASYISRHCPDVEVPGGLGWLDRESQAPEQARYQFRNRVLRGRLSGSQRQTAEGQQPL